MIKEIAIFSPIYISLFWSIVFLIQDGEKDSAKRQLGFFMILAVLLYSCHGIFFSKLFRLYASVEFIYVFTMLALYPMYFLYLKKITSDDFNLKICLLHLIPAITFSALVGGLTVFLSSEEKILYVKVVLIEKNLKELNLNTIIGIKGFVFLLSRIFLLFQIVYYAIRGIVHINRYNEKIADYYSNTTGKTLHWVRVINIVLLVTAISSTVLVFLGRGFFSQHEVSLIIPSAVFSTILFIIGYKGNYQRSINTDFDEYSSELTEDEEMDASERRLKSELLILFSRNKLYTRPDLRITHISEQLKTNRTYISKVINEEFHMNFNEFVNQYRVEEAKNLLENPSHRFSTLDEIAEKSGFGSLNSFARIFKQKTGKTPGKYRDRMINNKE